METAGAGRRLRRRGAANTILAVMHGPASHRALATLLIAVQAVLGVGGGERVVYLSHDHASDERCASSDDHGHGALTGRILFVPVVANDHGRHVHSDEHEHSHDHDGCRHAHLATHDATAPRSPDAPSRRVGDVLPAFLAHASAEPSSSAERAAHPSPAPPRPRPPDALTASVRLLI
jgi:hypothetical protein